MGGMGQVGESGGGGGSSEMLGKKRVGPEAAGDLRAPGLRAGRLGRQRNQEPSDLCTPGWTAVLRYVRRRDERECKGGALSAAQTWLQKSRCLSS
jgi:hypothetical protein